MTLDEIKSYYSNLLISQYRNRPKASNTIKAMVGEFSCDDLVRIESTCFNLDLASGAQLDIIGKIVGVPRDVYGLDLTHFFFAFGRYGDSTGEGFLRYSDTPDPFGMFSRYKTTAYYVLSDSEMRSLIKIKIIFNTAGGKLKNVVEALWLNFGSGILLEDNNDSTITFTVASSYRVPMLVAEFLNFLPRSMGVSADIVNA